MTTIQRTHRSTRPSSGGMMWLLYLVDAGLLVASGLIHLHLWAIAYRNVGTLDVLFLVQTALCLLAALVLLITRHLLVVLGAAALMAGTIVGFILARSVGIFGFHLTFSSGLAWDRADRRGGGRGDAAADRRPPRAAPVSAPRLTRPKSRCPLEDNPSSGRGTA